MLLRADPFRELDRFFEAATQASSNVARAIPMSAVRRGERVEVTFDLPGVDRSTIDLSVERNQLTLSAERRQERQEGDDWLVAERPAGRFSRTVFLGDNLDSDRIEADYRDGVLHVVVPVAERAKPRKVSIGSSDSGDTHEPIEAKAS
jgi:HSP20 family protein